jgi:hypothetical protein
LSTSSSLSYQNNFLITQFLTKKKKKDPLITNSIKQVEKRKRKKKGAVFIG